MRKVSFGPKKKIKQLKAKSLGLNKAQKFKKKEKVSSRLEKEIKQLRAESLRLDKAQGLERKKNVKIVEQCIWDMP